MENGPFIGDVPIQKVIFHSYVNLPESMAYYGLPSGKRLHKYGKSHLFIGKKTISMAIFNRYVSHYQRV